MNMWKRQPCHVVKARIDRFVIHQGSFHTLKGNGLLNDEVSIKILIFCVILEHMSQIINGYLKLLAALHGNCHVIISQTLTSVINRVAVLNKLHLLTKVDDFLCLKNMPLFACLCDCM